VLNKTLQMHGDVPLHQTGETMSLLHRAWRGCSCCCPWLAPRRTSLTLEFAGGLLRVQLVNSAFLHSS